MCTRIFTNTLQALSEIQLLCNVDRKVSNERKKLASIIVRLM